MVLATVNGAVPVAISDVKVSAVMPNEPASQSAVRACDPSRRTTLALLEVISLVRAIVPSASGTVRVLVFPAVMLPSSSCACLVLSPSSCRVSVLSA